MAQHRYTTPWEGSDVTFTVQDELFHCHLAILNMNSPVFRAMFSGHYREGTNQPVPLPGKEKTAFSVFLDLLYPLSHDSELTTNRTVLAKVLEYANEYQVESVRFHIDNALCLKVYAPKCNIGERELPVVMEDLLLSNRFALKGTRDVCLRLILELANKNSVMSLTEGTVFNELEGETKFEILTRLFGEYASKHACGNCSQKNVFHVLADICGVDVSCKPRTGSVKRLSKF